MFMRYLGGAPGHRRKHTASATSVPAAGMTDAELAEAAEDPTVVECEIVSGAAAAQLPDQMDDQSGSEDEDDAFLEEDTFRVMDGDDVLDNDELAYALVGLPVP